MPTPPRTARDLLAALGPYGPAAEGTTLTLGPATPADLVAAVRVLHTGVRAVLTGRRWFGSDTASTRGGELDPAAALPAWARLLTVEGDRGWDRLHPRVRDELPHLFVPADPSPARRRRG